MTSLKTIFKPQYFLKIALYIMFTGQLWTNNSYTHFNKIASLKEYFFIADFDNNTDLEFDFEKHFKNTICSLNTFNPSLKVFKLKHNFHYNYILRPVDHLEIHTPPPDFS